MKKTSLTLLLLMSCAQSCLSQTTIEQKFGVFFHETTYTYEGQKFHPKYKSAGFGFALAFRNGLGKRLSLGTEIGFIAFQNVLDIEFGNRSIKGDHKLQQMYFGLVPQYALLKKQGLGQVFVKAGSLFFLNTKSELDKYDGLQTFDVGYLTRGYFGGIGANLQLGKTGLGLQIEYRYTVQSPTKESGGYEEPEKFSLRYSNLFWAITYQLN